jgi:hypothetical protein
MLVFTSEFLVVHAGFAFCGVLLGRQRPHLLYKGGQELYINLTSRYRQNKLRFFDDLFDVLKCAAKKTTFKLSRPFLRPNGFVMLVHHRATAQLTVCEQQP